MGPPVHRDADAVSYFHGALETKDFDGTKYGTGTIIIKGGTIAAEGGVYWVSGEADYQRRIRNRFQYPMESAEPLKYWVETITAEGGRIQEPESEAELVEV